MADVVAPLVEFGGQVELLATYDDVTGVVSQLSVVNADARTLLVEVRDEATWALLTSRSFSSGSTMWNVPGNTATFETLGARFRKLTNGRALCFIWPV